MPSFKRPTTYAVKRIIRLTHQNQKYQDNTRTLDRLFQLYPRNNKIEEVYLKVVALNEIFSTNIYDTYKVATHIVRLKIDKRLRRQTPGIVHRIAKYHNVKKASGGKRNFYSFATKYCSWHVRDFYPIYDSYVAAALISYRNSHEFYTFKNDDLKKYRKFVTIIEAFRVAFYSMISACGKSTIFYGEKGGSLNRKNKS